VHRSGQGGPIIDCRMDDLDREARFYSRVPRHEIGRSEDPEGSKYVVLDTRHGEPYSEPRSVEHPSTVDADIKTDDVAAADPQADKSQAGGSPASSIQHQGSAGRVVDPSPLSRHGSAPRSPSLTPLPRVLEHPEPRGGLEVATPVRRHPRPLPLQEGALGVGHHHEVTAVGRAQPGDPLR
jgi:hypothetical protein